MLIVDMMLKRAMKGELDLMAPAMAVAKELTSIPDFSSGDDGDPLAAEKKALANLKKIVFMVAGSAVQKLMAKLDQEQEILMHLADIVMEVYSFESALLKTEKLLARGPAEVELDLLRIYMHRAIDVSGRAAREALYAFAEGDELRMMLMGLKRFTKAEPFNLKDARRRVADRLIAANGYCF
jgi:hypothetical protein